MRARPDPSLALAILGGVALACAHAGPAGDPEAAARRLTEGEALVARETDDALLDTLFGDDLGAALPVGAPDATLAKCQQSVTKALLKCHDTRLKTYTKCNKSALAGGATTASATIACIGDDPKGKIAKSCDLNAGGSVDKIRAALTSSCASVDLQAAFPGCNTTDAETLHA